MSSNESEDFEDPETEQTQVYQSDQDEMHFYQDEKVKEVKTELFVIRISYLNIRPSIGSIIKT